jgi:hypothetical protein
LKFRLLFICCTKTDITSIVNALLLQTVCLPPQVQRSQLHHSLVALKLCHSYHKLHHSLEVTFHEQIRFSWRPSKSAPCLTLYLISYVLIRAQLAIKQKVAYSYVIIAWCDLVSVFKLIFRPFNFKVI